MSQAPVSIVLGTWIEMQSLAIPIRTEVFVHEQLVPLEEEIDDFDPLSVHAVAIDERGQALATGRLLPDGHIGRMAVQRHARRTGVGSEVLKALINAAQQRGDKQLILHAQTHATMFYLRHGFTAIGDEFMEANIPHIMMRMSID